MPNSENIRSVMWVPEEDWVEIGLGEFAEGEVAMSSEAGNGNGDSNREPKKDFNSGFHARVLYGNAQREYRRHRKKPGKQQRA
jgi:hypothetical protein